MKWFKHDGNARGDEKIEKLLIKYGVEGYGLYFYCVEIIAGNLSSENITFELKHDAETIAHRLQMDTIRVEEIMRWMVGQGLFQVSPTSQKIACYGLAKRLDISTSNNPEIKRLLASPKFREILESIRNYQNLIAEEKRREETRREENKEKNTLSSCKQPDAVSAFIDKQKDEKEQIPYKQIIQTLNRECQTNFKDTTETTRRLIKARWHEGWRLEDFELVVKAKAREWLSNEKMMKYLRPQTLLGTKFESYLQAAQQKISHKKICPECKLEAPYHLPSCPRAPK